MKLNYVSPCMNQQMLNKPHMTKEEVLKLKELDQIEYVDSFSIQRTGRVLRTRETEKGFLFLTVQSLVGIVEVIRDPSKILKLII